MCEVVREIHKIREKNYEATKNMTEEEWHAYYDKGAQEVEKEIEYMRRKRKTECLI